MNYWAKIAGAIVIAYFIYTTTKGNLPAWLEIIGLKASRASATGPAGVKLRGKEMVH